MLDGFQGQCWTQHRNWKDGQAEEYGLRVLKSREGKGLATDPEWLITGGNSGYQGINLAYHLGARRIILLGFDMSRDNGRAHWFGEHPRGLVRCANYEQYADAYRSINPARYGLEIINCSRRSVLDMFPRMDLAAAL